MGAVRKARRRLWRLADGTVLDEAAIEALADEFEAGPDFDLASAGPAPRVHVPRRYREKRTPGRPRLSHAQQGPAPRLSLRLPPDVYAAALARARSEQRTISQLAREALERYVRAD